VFSGASVACLYTAVGGARRRSANEKSKLMQNTVIGIGALLYLLMTVWKRIYSTTDAMRAINSTLRYGMYVQIGVVPVRNGT
jgi:hypothetical protein